MNAKATVNDSLTDAATLQRDGKSQLLCLLAPENMLLLVDMMRPYDFTMIVATTITICIDNQQNNLWAPFARRSIKSSYFSFGFEHSHPVRLTCKS